MLSFGDDKINKVVNKQVVPDGKGQTISYEWHVNNLIATDKGTALSHEAVVAGGVAFRLQFFPRGYTSPGWASMYLSAPAAKHNEDFKCFVDAMIRVQKPAEWPDPDSREQPEKPDEDAPIEYLDEKIFFSVMYDHKKSSYGKAELFELDRLMGEGRAEDPMVTTPPPEAKMIFHVRITAISTIKFDPVDDKGEQRRGQHQFCWRVHNFNRTLQDMQPGKRFMSSQFHVADRDAGGLPWSFVLYPAGYDVPKVKAKTEANEEEEDEPQQEQYLSLYLLLAKAGDELRKVTFMLDVFDNNEGVHRAPETGKSVYQQTETFSLQKDMRGKVHGVMHGFRYFLARSEILDDKNEPRDSNPYVLNNTVEFRCEIWLAKEKFVQAKLGLLMPPFDDAFLKPIEGSELEIAVNEKGTGFPQPIDKCFNCKKKLRQNFHPFRNNCHHCGNVFCSSCVENRQKLDQEYGYDKDDLRSVCGPCNDIIGLNKSIAYKRKFRPFRSAKKGKIEDPKPIPLALDARNAEASACILLWEPTELHEKCMSELEVLLDETGKVERSFLAPCPNALKPFHRHHCRRCGKLYCDDHMAEELSKVYGWDHDIEEPPLFKLCVHCEREEKENLEGDTKPPKLLRPVPRQKDEESKKEKAEPGKAKKGGGSDSEEEEEEEEEDDDSLWGQFKKMLPFGKKKDSGEDGGDTAAK